MAIKTGCSYAKRLLENRQIKTELRLVLYNSCLSHTYLNSFKNDNIHENEAIIEQRACERYIYTYFLTLGYSEFRAQVASHICNF